MIYKKELSVWLAACLFMIFLIVIVGGSVRLTQSGLSMVDWKPITGILPPLNESEWFEEFQKYKSFPEYQKMDQKINLDEYKYIYWWEYIHRALGRALGLIFLIPFIIFLFQGKISKNLGVKLFFMFFLGALQGLVGWLMVKSGLSGDPHVSHYRLALHLSLAYFIFCYILWIALGLNHPKKNTLTEKQKLPFHGNLWLIVLLGVQIVYGAFVAGLKAGYIYNTFPLMGSSFFPERFFYLEPAGRNFFDNPGVVQFIHRVLGYILFVLGALFTYYVNRYHSELKRPTNIAFSLLILQVLLGIFTIIFAVPIWLGVMHQANSLLLLAYYVACLHRQLFSTDQIK